MIKTFKTLSFNTKLNLITFGADAALFVGVIAIMSILKYSLHIL